MYPVIHAQRRRKYFRQNLGRLFFWVAVASVSLPGLWFGGIYFCSQYPAAYPYVMFGFWVNVAVLGYKVLDSGWAVIAGRRGY